MTRSLAIRYLVGALLAALLLAARPAAARDRFEEEILDGLAIRPLGPANMGGRVTAVTAVDKNASVIYLATASGGLWKTTNNGTTWKAVFEHEATASIGDVAVAPSRPDIVWVGTGEANPRNSVACGTGVYRSLDGGKSWQQRGLADTEHIARVLIHPTNPNIVYVAALGRLWAPNRQRGIFKTEDGGATWQTAEFLDEDTGFIDLVMDPSDPNTLYAAAYCCRRGPFSGSNPARETGPAAGIYKTTDAGKSWTRLRRGLPERALGRCGLSICRTNPRIVYAVVQTERTERGLAGQEAKSGTNADTGGVFRSDNAGQSWIKCNDLCPRPFYYGQIRADPSDGRRVYVLGPTLYASSDGGRTFKGDAAPGVHADLHTLWIDPNHVDHLLLGGDGGLDVSYDRGSTWEHLNQLPIGQFYSVSVDNSRPYRVYGGLQDNGTWSGPSATRAPEGITAADWVRLLGADGFCCRVDPTDPDIVYAETQYGGLNRVNVRTGARRFLQPQSSDDAWPYRFNWNAPILVSPHDPRALYFGGNCIFRSYDRGERWEIASPDLTRGPPGRSRDSGHTITTIAESPARAGLLFAGSDDGRVNLSRDGGRTWADISDRVPGAGGRWVNHIECSPADENTVYVAIDRHRFDDRAPYLYRSDDGGATWTSLAAGLPQQGTVAVIREDPRNRELLFAGTDSGLFVSPDSGRSWHRLPLPTVAVADLAIQARERELVIATHGRSLYVVDIAPLEDLTRRVADADVYLFEIRPALKFAPHGSHGQAGAKFFAAPNPPYGAAVDYYLKNSVADPVVLTISDAEGTVVAALKGEAEAGLHRVVWDLRASALALPGRPEAHARAGDYSVRLEAGGTVRTRKLQILTED